MATAVSQTHALLVRLVAGQPLSPGEREWLTREAQVLQARVARLYAIDPEAAGTVELHPALAALAEAPVRVAV